MSQKPETTAGLQQPDFTELLSERYGTESKQPPVLENEILHQILQHRSVRAFQSRPLPDDLLPTLVAAAQAASSSSNLQVWSVLAVQDQAHKDRLAVLARNQDFVRQAPLLLVWLVDFSRLQAVAQQQGVKLEGADYLEALVLGSVDTALAAQNAVLTAESLGLGAVYVGALRSHVEEVAQELRLPPHVFPVFGTAIGYPAADVPTFIKPRLPQSAVLHHEHYDASTQLAGAGAYDRALDAFWKKQGIEHPVWTQHVISRLQVNQQDGRYQLKDILNRLGFPLR